MENKFCFNCGTKLDENANFCFSCGTRVNGMAKEHPIPIVDDINRFINEAERGDTESQFYLYNYFFDQKDVNDNDSKALKWLMKASEGGHAEAQYLIGKYYNKGILVEQNYQESLKWFRLAAEKGHKVALYNLGIVYIKGIGVKKNIPEAIHHLEKALSNHYFMAYQPLGLCYYKMGDYEKTIHYLEKAENINDQFLNMLGFAYYHTKNYQKAIAYLEKLIHIDNKVWFTIGACYLEMEDFQNAISCFEKAVEFGMKEAYYYLGQCYAEINDQENALIYLEKAADQGDKKAIRILESKNKNDDYTNNDEKIARKTQVEGKKSMGFWDTVGKVTSVLMQEAAKKQGEMQRKAENHIRDYEKKLNQAQKSNKMANPVYAQKVNEAKQKLFQAKQNFYGDAKATNGSKKGPETGTASLKDIANPALYVNDFGVYILRLNGQIMKVGSAEIGVQKRMQQYYGMNQHCGLSYINEANKDKITITYQHCPVNKCNELESKLFDKYGGVENMPWAQRRPHNNADTYPLKI